MKIKHLTMIALVFVMASCVKTKTYYVNDNNRDWFADSTYCHFTMSDENGVAQSFKLHAKTQNMLETGASFLMIPTDKAEHEELYQSGFNSYSTANLYVSITAYKNDEEHEDADDFSMYFNGSIYVMRIDGNLFYDSKCYETGNENEMECIAEYMDSYEVNGVSYEDVMHLKIDDVNYPRSNNFPTEIYYAKHYGLIQCTLDDKVTLCRLPD